FVPCAGPVLAAISVAAANHRVSASSLFVTLFYAVGAALPLLFFAVLAQRAATGWQRLRTHLPTVRRVGGVVLAATTLAIAFGAFDPLQRAVPGYTSALENHVEGSASITKQLQSLSGEHANAFATDQSEIPAPKAATLPVLGTAAPLLAVAVAGSQLTGRIRAIRRQAPQVRRVGGVVLVVVAVAIAFNLFGGLQRDVPGYSSALQGSATVRKQLNAITGAPHTSLSKCPSTATTLVNCGPAPNFSRVTAWLNTPGGKPLSLRGLRGKVVLVDFWTYSCINCQRTLPHVEAWYREYAKDGFVVVGVHTPEFAFEHVVSNVRAESASLGVRYPVAVDDDYGTWNAYDNEYWPADYLIDAKGDVRHVTFGEGGYSNTEQLIRQLLDEAHPRVALPAATGVPNLTPTGEMSPETYVGFDRLQYLVPDQVTRNAPARYEFPASLPLGAMGLSGTWTDHAQEATAGSGAQLELGFLAQDVYLVLGGSGTLDVSVNGHAVQTIHVSGVPRLYTLYRAGSEVRGKLLLRASPGVQAFDFTFG
ncbi:MAG TPA: cytochrome c biogenesis protein CcdA, partial [Streptosporangiaceae bacterium]|nr:cytochrome c biogenesis protein CcdA [Streptosporangiaceae bacterium]